MRTLGRFVVVLAATFGGLTASQLPEFAQQYRQRLGGALAELNRIVSEFEADAARNRLTRDEAVRTYTTSNETFLRDQGVSVTGTLSRQERLAEQRARLESAPPIMRPVVMLSHTDETVMRGAWTDFEPAVPVTSAGFVWAAIGFFLLGGIVSMLRQLIGIWRRRARTRRLQPEA
ncbi:MAG: DUF2937 family protein [Pseudomonadota bacterium]|nr:DUF2937 family protein [Pseudomonadota bacterium]